VGGGGGAEGIAGTSVSVVLRGPPARMAKPAEKSHVVQMMDVSLAGIQGTREAAARDAAAEQGYHVTSDGLAAMVKDNQLNFVKALGGGDGA
jgi:hypothetical protein